MVKVAVGGVIYNRGKYLLVQEAQAKCYGKWNIPTGKLELNESVLEGTVREIKEETGCDVSITGILQIVNKKCENNNILMFTFATKLVNLNIGYSKDEILDAKWFSYEEIMNMDGQLRDYEVITSAIDKHYHKEFVDLNILKILN